MDGSQAIVIRQRHRLSSTLSSPFSSPSPSCRHCKGRAAGINSHCAQLSSSNHIWTISSYSPFQGKDKRQSTQGSTPCSTMSELCLSIVILTSIFTIHIFHKSFAFRAKEEAAMINSTKHRLLENMGGSVSLNCLHLILISSPSSGRKRRQPRSTQRSTPCSTMSEAPSLLRCSCPNFSGCAGEEKQRSNLNLIKKKLPVRQINFIPKLPRYL